MFLGLPDPDPSLIMQNSKKNLDSYYFVALFDFFSLKNDVQGGSDKSGIFKVFFKNPTAQLKIIRF